MSTSKVLRQLYSLDTSSPEFLPRLYCLIQTDEEEQYLSSLRGSESARLVDFLDEVLDVISITDDVSRRCLHKLQAICNQHKILPSSYKVPGDIARIGSHPVTSGGFSDVWEGLHNNRKVCIKYLRITQLSFEAVEKRFYKEAIMWKRFRHPNIVPFIGVTQNPLQFVSEWMPNGTLTEYLGKNPGADRIRLLLDVAEGLTFLHASHTTHGDLKGPNILIDHDGRARLTDFGLSSVVRGISSVLVTKVQGYSPRWAAPEVLDSGDKNTREADVFAFGMVVIEVFTGNYPFSEFTDSVTIAKIMDGERPDRPKEPDLTDSIWAMTIGCWLEDPVRRPAMTKVVAILRECYRLYTAKQHPSALTTPLPAASLHSIGGSTPILHVSMDQESTTTHQPGIDGTCVESLLRITGPFEQLTMDREPSVDSDSSSGLWGSERGVAWLRDQNLRTIKSPLGDLPRPCDVTPPHPGSGIEDDVFRIWGGSGGKYHNGIASAVVSPRAPSSDTGTEEDSSVVMDEAGRRQTSMEVVRLDPQRQGQDALTTYQSPPVKRISSDPTPMRDFSQLNPDIPGDVLPLLPSISLPPPKEFTSCSECGSILDTIRYVCSMCKEKVPKTLKELEALTEGSKQCLPDGKSNPGYELCPGCLGSVGLHHALEMSLGPGSSPSPASPEDVLSAWRRTGPKQKGNLRHAYAKKMWGWEGWQDVQQDDLANNRCSTCNCLLASQRYKCASCVQFNLCRGCYGQVHETHPSHAFLDVFDRRLSGSRSNCDLDATAYRSRSSEDIASQSLSRPGVKRAQSLSRDRPRLRFRGNSFDGTVGLNDTESADGLSHGVSCDYCLQMIIGARYQCGNCPTIPHPYNLCQSCDDKSYMVHDPTHVFFKLPRPVDRPVESTEPILPPLYQCRVASCGTLDAHDPKAYLHRVMHVNIVCDLCMDQIWGQWFHCMYCPRDLCGHCEEVDEHDRNHFFMVAKAPVEMNRFFHFARISEKDGSTPPILKYSVYHS